MQTTRSYEVFKWYSHFANFIINRHHSLSVCLTHSAFIWGAGLHTGNLISRSYSLRIKFFLIYISTGGRFICALFSGQCAVHMFQCLGINFAFVVRTHEINPLKCRLPKQSLPFTGSFSHNFSHTYTRNTQWTVIWHFTLVYNFPFFIFSLVAFVQLNSFVKRQGKLPLQVIS